MTEKYTAIPRRIKNVTVGGHVAGAEDIIDDELQLTQAEINALVLGGSLNVRITATPSPVLVGAGNTINIVASIDTPADSIKIKKGETVIATGSGVSLSCTDTIVPNVAGNIPYTAEFTLGGLLKPVGKNVVAVYPVKYGAGDDYTDAQTLASARTTPTGTYNIVVPNDGDYVFFVVPRTMSINSAKMSGFDFPLQTPVNVEIGGVEYKYYQSGNTYNAGTLTIVIS